jgi:hypothetical protein
VEHHEHVGRLVHASEQATLEPLGKAFLVGHDVVHNGDHGDETTQSTERLGVGEVVEGLDVTHIEVAGPDEPVPHGPAPHVRPEARDATRRGRHRRELPRLRQLAPELYARVVALLAAMRGETLHDDRVAGSEERLRRPVELTLRMGPVPQDAHVQLTTGRIAARLPSPGFGRIERA